MPQRFKLLITTANQPETIQGKNGAFQKLTFTATNSDRSGEALTYQVFSQKLFPLIVSGHVIDADVETSSREYNGNTYTDRKVTQIYQDGQAVNQKGNFRDNKRSPEERASIEKQVCLKCACEIAEKGTSVEEILRNAQQMWAWMGGQDAQTAKAATETVKAPADDFDKTFGKPKGRTFDSAKAFNDAAYEAFKVTPIQFPLSVTRYFNAKQYSEAWVELEKDIAAARAQK